MISNSTVEIQKKSTKSVKWSFFGELFSKIATPISTMILARLLVPEIFGIATAVTIVMSFCEVVSESGFAKYIIQKDFENESDFNKHLSVSIIFSLILSVIMCLLVIIFRNPLSAFVGNSGYEMVLAVSCAQIPFASLNALLLAELKREFKFKAIFVIKLVYSFIPFFVTIPLAFLGMSFWSLVIGSISAQVIEMIAILIVRKKKINLYFSFGVLKEMIGASSIMILESIIIWGCSWTSTIVAANFFNQTVVGVVKVANSTVNSIFSLFSTTFIAVLFPALSRLKDSPKDFEETYFSIQSAALALLVPVGIGGFFFADVISSIFLGSKWTESTFVISVFCLTKPLSCCFNNFLSEVFRSKGHFKTSIFYQLSMLAIDLILRFTLGRVDYVAFIYCVTVSDIIMTTIAVVILKLKYKFRLSKQIKVAIPSFVCVLAMVPFLLLNSFNSYSIYQSIFQVIICAAAYFSCLIILFPKVFNKLTVYFKIKNE